jgi:hypothetical protein
MQSSSSPGGVVLEKGSNFVQATPLVENMVGFTNDRRARCARGGFALGKNTLIYKAQLMDTEDNK